MGLFQTVPFNFGNASDGPFVLDGVSVPAWATLAGTIYTIVRNPYLTDLTVKPGITLNMNGYSLWGVGTLAIAATGIIESSATNDAQAGGTAGQGSAGNGASAPSNGVGNITQIETQNGNGNNGGSSGGVGAGSNGPGPAGNSPPFGLIPGPAGDGGTGVSGAGGVAQPYTGSFVSFQRFVISDILAFGGPGSLVAGGIAGGGGASGAGDGVNNGGGGAGGGAGGGVVVILFNKINNLGTIQANGSSGAAGESPPVGNVGGGGGGGGGTGGLIFMIYSSLVAGVIQALGATFGAGGTGIGTGTAGTAGTAGSAGVILKFNIAKGVWE